MFLINPVHGKPKTFWSNLNTKGFILTEGVNFDPPDIFAEYLDFDFHMYVYGTLLEIFERYFEIEASRVSYHFLTSFPKINIPTGSEKNLKNGESKWPTCYILYPGTNMQQCLAVTLQYKFNFLQLPTWYLQLEFIFNMYDKI